MRTSGKARSPGRDLRSSFTNDSRSASIPHDHSRMRIEARCASSDTTAANSDLARMRHNHFVPQLAQPAYTRRVHARLQDYATPRHRPEQPPGSLQHPVWRPAFSIPSVNNNREEPSECFAESKAAQIGGGLTLNRPHHSSQRTDDFPIGCFLKCFQSFSGDISKCTSREGKLCTSFITGELGNKNGIVLAHRQVPSVNLSSFGFGGFLRRVEAGRAVFDF
jgi:hypothetical protein